MLGCSYHGITADTKGLYLTVPSLLHAGFSSSVDQQLLLASKVLTCNGWEKYVVVLVDEMHRYI